MKKFLLFSVCALAFAACQIDIQNELPVEEVKGGAPATFNVVSPETKTTLDGLHIYWAAGDQIRVYGHNTDTDSYTDNGTYTLTSGAGTASAVFAKDDDEALTGNYDEFYAIYPGNLTATVSASTIVFPRLNTGDHHFRAQNPVAGGFDPNLALMTAKYDGSSFAFRYGVGFVKITIPDDGITQVDINFTNNCIGDTPTYSSSTGALTSVANSNKSVASAEGSFTKGTAYYFAATPRSGYTIGTTTITMTGGATVSTSHFSGKSIEVGKVFDLGTPAIATAPIISASDVPINYDATAGNIAFSIVNPAGGVLTAATTGGKVNTIDSFALGAVGDGTVPFTCSANASADAKYAYITLTYTYNTDQTVTKDVVITQAGAPVNKDWNFSSSEWITKITSEFTTKDTNQNDINFTYDGLTVNGGGKSMKYNYNGETYWIQAGGAGGSSTRRFEYTAPEDGTITVYFSNTGNNTARYVKVKDTAGEKSGSVTTENITMVNEAFSVKAGLIQIYPTDGLRFYRIVYTPAS